MSLINDALKQASAKPRLNPDLPAAIPVVEQEGSSSGVAAAARFALIFLLGAIVAVVWFNYGRGPKSPQTSGNAAPATNKTGLNPIERAREVLNKVATKNTEGTETAETMQTKTTLQTVPSIEGTKVEPLAQGELPPVRLQAIFFRTNRPTAVLNGKTVSPGQMVDGMKVISIGRAAVEVEFQGTRKTISLR